MKLVRTLVVAASLSFALAGPSRAQDAKPDSTRPEVKKSGSRRGLQMGQRLKETLGLSDDQAKQIDKIAEEVRADLKKVGENGQKPDRDEMRKRMKETRDKVLEKIKAVLTDEQKQKYEDYLRKQQEQRSKRANKKTQQS